MALIGAERRHLRYTAERCNEDGGDGVTCIVAQSLPHIRSAGTKSLLLGQFDHIEVPFVPFGDEGDVGGLAAVDVDPVV